MSATSPISKQLITVEERQQTIREQLHSRMNQRDLEWKQEVEQLKKQFFTDGSVTGMMDRNRFYSSGSDNWGVNNNNNNRENGFYYYNDTKATSSNGGNFRENNVYSPDSIKSSFTPPISPDLQHHFQQQNFDKLSSSTNQQQQQNKNYYYQQQPQQLQQQPFQQQQPQQFTVLSKRPTPFSSNLSRFSHIGDINPRSNVISPTNFISNSSSSSSSSSLSPVLFRHEFEVKNFLPEEIKVTTEKGKLIVFASHKETGLNKSVSKEFKRTVDIQNDLDPSQLLCTLTQDGKLIVEISKSPPSSKPCQFGFDDVRPSAPTLLANNNFNLSAVDNYLSKNSSFVSTRFRPIETQENKFPSVSNQQQMSHQVVFLNSETTSSDINHQPTLSTLQSNKKDRYADHKNEGCNKINTNKNYINGLSYTFPHKKTSLPDLIDTTNHNIDNYSQNCTKFQCDNDSSSNFFTSRNKTDALHTIEQTHSADYYNHQNSPNDLDQFTEILKLSDDQNLTYESGVTVIRSTNRPFHVGLNVGFGVDPNDMKIDAVDGILLVRISNSWNANDHDTKKTTRMWKVHLPEELDPVNMNAHLTDEGLLLLEETC
ncbi:hypothetical protein HELRODRAFT_191185 [Helobdella robusta]|uniref:SHSP domain-containing protein n=1 Tax=Helobdella robusta TaxID=6412 RepID=T1FSQ1_HELRO|nr:hypothetical protein HELRODRAFT_191185 [Helobdella robusta]ESO06761.1 hypothetical protein HELRODRAFT_191185 [Helobdella robusta]